MSVFLRREQRSLSPDRVTRAWFCGDGLMSGGPVAPTVFARSSCRVDRYANTGTTTWHRLHRLGPVDRPELSVPEGRNRRDLSCFAGDLPVVATRRGHCASEVH